MLPRTEENTTPRDIARSKHEHTLHTPPLNPLKYNLNHHHPSSGQSIIWRYDVSAFFVSSNCWRRMLLRCTTPRYPRIVHSTTTHCTDEPHTKMASITNIPSGAYRVQTRRKGRCGRETFRRRDDAHRWTRQAETRGALPIAGCQRSRTPATLCEITRPNHEYTYRMITRNHLESYTIYHHPSSTRWIAPREETQLNGGKCIGLRS